MGDPTLIQTLPTMRILPPLAFVLALPFGSCAHGPQEGDGHLRAAGPATDIATDAFAFDITQHTCAMYVALRSSALEDPIAFGRDLEDVGVHWNMCPGGTMVACASPPSASGDTLRTGIPWPY